MMPPWSCRGGSSHDIFRLCDDNAEQVTFCGAASGTANVKSVKKMRKLQFIVIYISIYYHI